MPREADPTVGAFMSWRRSVAERPEEEPRRAWKVTAYKAVLADLIWDGALSVGEASRRRVKTLGDARRR